MLCYDAMSHDAWSSCIDVCSDIVWNAFHMDACPGGLVNDACAASTHLRLQGWTSGFWTFLISCFIQQKDKDTTTDCETNINNMKSEECASESSFACASLDRELLCICAIGESQRRSPEP